MRKPQTLNPHLHAHLHPRPQTLHTPLRQKSITSVPIPFPLNNHSPALQNHDLHKSDVKPKIMFNYSPSTPKFVQEDSLVKTSCSPPKAIPSLEKTMDSVFQPASTPAKVQAAKTVESAKEVAQTLQFSRPILLQRNKNQFQKRKQAKSKPQYAPIAEVVSTLEDSHYEPQQQKREQPMLALHTLREEEMLALRKELNQTRSLNNQLRTDLLRCHSKLQQTEEAARKREEELQQELKELRIELQKAQNEKLLAEVSEAELQRKIRKMQEDEKEKDEGRAMKGREQSMLNVQNMRERVFVNGNYVSYIL